jgi:hypothetical protein
MLKITTLIIFILSFITISGQSSIDSTSTEDILYSAVIVESVPTFNGGFDSLVSWMERNINFPEEELDNFRKETRVYASFIVEKDGSISTVKTYTIYDKFNQEVEKALIKMPNWIPAFEDNKPVRCRMRIPVNFKIEENKRRR